MIACRQQRFDSAACDSITQQAVAGYQTGMGEAAAMRTLDVWYDHLTTERLVKAAEWSERPVSQRAAHFEQQAPTRDSLRPLHTLAFEENGRFHIRSDPPVLLPLREIPEIGDPATVLASVRATYESYKGTMGDDRRVMLDRFRPVDVAQKVVGVGSVGTRCFIMLLEGRASDDPLFLQVKEAGASVLEEHLGPHPYANQGQRVVEGQRLAQAVSDILLGWTRDDREGVDYYVRQLRDWKGSVDVPRLTPDEVAGYAYMCGWTLARGHARSGDPVALAAYMGRSDAFDRAVTAFAASYARQNDADYAAFTAAIRKGRLTATPGR